jgi:hypothetical protein
MSWLRPWKRSASVSFPFGPSNTYFFSTFSHGNSRRARLSSSRNRVNSFSFFSSSFRAATHSAGDATFACFIIGVAIVVSPLDEFNGFIPNVLWDLAHPSPGANES